MSDCIKVCVKFFSKDKEGNIDEYEKNICLAFLERVLIPKTGYYHYIRFGDEIDVYEGATYKLTDDEEFVSKLVVAFQQESLLTDFNKSDEFIDGITYVTFYFDLLNKEKKLKEENWQLKTELDRVKNYVAKCRLCGKKRKPGEEFKECVCKDD